MFDHIPSQSMCISGIAILVYFYSHNLFCNVHLWTMQNDPLIWIISMDKVFVQMCLDLVCCYHLISIVCEIYMKQH